MSTDQDRQMKYKAYYEPYDHTVLVLGPGENENTVPYGFHPIGERFDHDENADPLGWEGNHVLWHHIRECLYADGVTDFTKIKMIMAKDGLYPPLIPTDPPGPKIFQSDTKTKTFTTDIALGSRMAMLEISVLCYGRPVITATHGGEALELLHTEHSPEDTMHIFMFRGTLLTPDEAPLVITSDKDMLLMSGRMNDYPEFTKVGSYRTWHGQSQADYTLKKTMEPSQAVGLATTILTDTTEWAQRLIISPNLHLRSATQQASAAEEWVTLKEEDWSKFLPWNGDGVTNLWELKDGWWEHPGGADFTGHVRIPFPAPEITAFMEIEVEYELQPGASFAIRTFQTLEGDRTFNGRAFSNVTNAVQTAKVTFQSPNSNLSAGMYIYSRLINGGPAKVRVKATPRVRMKGRTLQTNFVRGNEELQNNEGFSMYYARANQGDVSLFGLSEISPIPVNP